MIKIRDPNLNLLTFIDPVDPALSEEINRGYEFNFSTYVDHDKSQYLTQDSVVDIEGQYFDVAQLQKSRSGAMIVIDAICEHVSYRLIEDKQDYFTADGTVEEVLEAILDGTDLEVGTVEINDTLTFAMTEETNKRRVLIEFAKYVGGELEYDGFTVHLRSRRGSDTGKQIRIGRDLKGIKKLTDAREKDELGNPLFAYEVNFIELSELPEYGDLEKVELGDTVRVIDEDLNIDVSLRVMKYERNPFRKKESTIMLANFLEDISDSITRIKRETVHKGTLYNGIRISPENGFESIRSDDKIRTLMNATEGISIQSNSGETWVDKFYADTDGNLHLDGHITARGGQIGGWAIEMDKLSGDGQINGGTITGSLIQTAEQGVYPRIEFSSTNNILEAYGNVNERISIRADYSSGLPALVFQNNEDLLYMLYDGFNYSVVSNSGFNLNPSGDIRLWPTGGGALVRVQNWNRLYNDEGLESLQQALNKKPDAGINTTVYVGDGAGGIRALTFDDGVLIAVS